MSTERRGVRSTKSTNEHVLSLQPPPHFSLSRSQSHSISLTLSLSLLLCCRKCCTCCMQCRCVGGSRTHPVRHRPSVGDPASLLSFLIVLFTVAPSAVLSVQIYVNSVGDHVSGTCYAAMPELVAARILQRYSRIQIGAVLILLAASQQRS